MSYLNLVSFLGIFGLCGVAWLFSENRKRIPWRVLVWGIGLQLLLGLFVFRVPVTRDFLDVLNSALNGLFTAAEAGARFVFGAQMVPSTLGESPPLGYIFAARALPTIVFFSGFIALLYHIGVIQPITHFFARLFYRTMGLSGAEALSGAANIFVGIEAAIVVKPFLQRMTRSELCAILACGFGTAASSTLAIYVSLLQSVFSNILGHLISASIMAIPACFVLSKILIPETEVPSTAYGIPTEAEAAMLAGQTPEKADRPRRVSAMDATIGGAWDGVKMAVSIAAVLIVLVGLVALVDNLFKALGGLPGPIGSLFKVITLANIEGLLFFPLTLLTGVAWEDAWAASVTIGRRLLETEIPAYQALAELRRTEAISDRTLLIVSYALSGFAHIPSVGIFVGGLSALVPQRRQEVENLGWRALFVGTLATLMIACVAGFYDDGSPNILGTPLPPPKANPAAAPTPPKPLATPAPAVTPAVAPTIPAPR